MSTIARSPGRSRDEQLRDPLAGLGQLVSPYGVVGSLTHRREANGLPLDLAIAQVGGRSSLRFAHRSVAAGIGRSISPDDDARLTAVAEGAERYSSADPVAFPTILSSYDDLPGPALDWRTYPRPSAGELANPACRIEAFDPTIPIRWVSGRELASGEHVWVPAVMACYGLERERGENFSYQISTGCAIHTSETEAVLRGLCEVIERDSLAISWLQMLSLPTIDHEVLNPAGRRLVEWCDNHFIRTHLFWGDLGLGVPLVLCLQVAPHDPGCRQLLGASTGRTVADAASKAVLEALAMRCNTWQADSAPQQIVDIHTIEDGAMFMASPLRSEAFDFLDPARTPTADSDRISALRLDEDPTIALDALTATLHEHRLAAAWINCTTPDLAAVGLASVRVVVPGLQPMCLRPPLAFRGHDRLYRAPSAAGFPVRSEEELNPWPHPMA